MIVLIDSTRLRATGATWFGAIRARFLRTIARRGFLSVLDQGFVSGTNFLTTIIIGRTCLPNQLGLYAIGFTVALLLMAVSRSLIWTPYTTFIPSKKDSEGRLFSGSTLVHQIALCAVLALAVSGVGAGLFLAGTTQGLKTMLLILGPAAALMVMREYVRRISFARLRVGQALMVDMTVAALQLAGLLMLGLNGTLNAPRAYLVILIANAPVVAAWIYVSRHTLAVQRDRVVVDFAHNWNFARWVLAGALVEGVSGAMNPWALSAMHGTVATGVFAAANTVFSLKNALVLSYGNFWGPHAAHVFWESGMRGLSGITKKATFNVALCMVAFTLFVAVFSEQILAIMFGPVFAGQGTVVTALAIGASADVILIPLTLALLAAGRGDILFKSYVIRLVISVTFGLWCIYQFGPMGVGYSWIVADLGAGLYNWIAFRSLVAND